MTDISKKQYLFSSRRIENVSMCEHRIGEYYLYTDKQLNTNLCKTSDGQDVFLLGNAFGTDIEGKNVITDIQSNTQEELEKATRLWTGRWAVVTSTHMFCDACTLMGAFYINKDGNFYVSSSLALLSNLLGIKSDLRVKETGLTWHFAPDTILPEVSALICTQRLRFFGQCAEAEFCSWINTEHKNLSTQEKCQKVADMLVNAVKNINTFSQRKIVLALTGGKDSRVTFSALVKSEVPFSAYTTEHPNISSSDVSVPVKLAKHFGVEHKYVRQGKFSDEKFEDYLHFAKYNTNGADARFYACGQFSQIQKDAVVIRSGLYEAGQTYSRSLCDNTLEGLRAGVVKYYSDLKEGSLQRNSFDKWTDYMKNNPIDDIDIRDRFYIEQRVGVWASAIEQSLDINDFISIQIANCKELLSVLLSCNEDERKKLCLSYGTIKQLVPEALDFDINKVSFKDKLNRVKQIAKNPVAKAKNYLNKMNRR